MVCEVRSGRDGGFISKRYQRLTGVEDFEIVERRVSNILDIVTWINDKE
jgi:hypothetical protein